MIAIRHSLLMFAFTWRTGGRPERRSSRQDWRFRVIGNHPTFEVPGTDYRPRYGCPAGEQLNYVGLKVTRCLLPGRALRRSRRFPLEHSPENGETVERIPQSAMFLSVCNRQSA
jgi:hypothetical protein